MKITVTRDDGTKADITEGVKIAYDCVINSMDWGSGFLDREEEDAIVALATACQFPDYAELAEDVRKEREAEERRIQRAAEERRRREEQARHMQRQIEEGRSAQAQRLRMMQAGWILP